MVPESSLPPGELPTDPIRSFHDWVPVIEPLDPAAALAAWLPPLILLIGGLLGIAWLWERSRFLHSPHYDQVDFDPEGESVLVWSAAELRLPGLLSASQRREMVWGVQRFESERTTSLLDVPATVRGSAEAGFPELHFARARYEREVWLWLDSRLRTREAVALADQIERELGRAGLRVRRATFPALPVKLRFATHEHASPFDLDAAARQALVALFTDGTGIAHTLDGTDSDRKAELERVLRELRTWPRLCLVDFSPPELDLPHLAARLGLACVAPDRLPAWLAERETRGPISDLQPITDLETRLWVAACALPRLPVTLAQTRDLYQALGLPPAWRLPAPTAGHSGADGIRFSNGERRCLLADLARWIWEDGLDSEAGRCLKTALDFWRARLADNTAHPERLADTTPDARWKDSGAGHEQAIERYLLDLWWGDRRTAQAVRRLWDRYQLYDHRDLQRLKRLIRERLGELSARGLESAKDDGRIVLPWHWRQLPEIAGEPPGTAHQRLLGMGFAGAKPGARKALGADTRLLFGAFAGIALAGFIAAGQRLATPAAVIVHDAPVYESPLFQSLVMERKHRGRLYAASRKLVAEQALLPGEQLRVHWCWSGVSAKQALESCRDLLGNQNDPRRVNVVPKGERGERGESALLRAGSLAEPIRACARDWPALSVAIIAGDPWLWPEQADNNLAARRLAIQLLDSGAVDLALIGPAESTAAQELASEWAFVTDSQWLFFSRLSEPTPGVPVPALGNHRALIHADYDQLAYHLRDRVDGVLDPADPDERLPPDVARIEVLAGTPRLWGGPEISEDPAGIEFVRICPGTFTMGSHSPSPDMADEDPARPYPEEFPAHPVLLDGFEIARTETTWDQLAVLRPEVVNNRGNQNGNWPAVSINWKDADMACRQLTTPGGSGKLPTEAQWEYAARGGAQTPWSWGDDPERAGDYAWYSGNSSYPSEPVKTKLPNPLGLHDMHGNIWEWTRDCYDADAYKGRSPYPTAVPIVDNTLCSSRVLRGGSFVNEPRVRRSAVRGRREPEGWDVLIGFRCVRGSGR